MIFLSHRQIISCQIWMVRHHTIIAFVKGFNMTSTNDTSSNDIPVRFEIGGNVISLDSVNRAARRMLQKQADNFRRKYQMYRDLRDSAGQGVTIVIKSPKNFVVAGFCCSRIFGRIARKN